MKALGNVIEVFLFALALLVFGVVLIGCDVFAPNTGPEDVPCPPNQPEDPTGPPGPTGSYPCPDIMKRGHCTDCKFEKLRGWYCGVCSGGYHANNISLCHPVELSCVKYCDGKMKQPLSRPSDVQGNNGKEWPSICLDTQVSNFFGIGDWGGIFGWDGQVGNPDKKAALCTQWYGEENVAKGMPCPMPNQRDKPELQAAPVEAIVQQKVSDRMSERAQQLKAEGRPIHFIVNVGDNFYPGGLNVHCGKEDNGTMTIVQKQFEQVWQNVYGDLTKEFEWWSVLGNHDYGGECYIKGWDQQIWYTYNADAKGKWLMPGQYWKRSVQYKNFRVEFFLLDTNWYDGVQQKSAPNHDICNVDMNRNVGTKQQVCSRTFYPPNPGIAWTDSCDNVKMLKAPDSAEVCPKWFDQLWNDQYKWLMKYIPGSTADWQIVVSHYPSSYIMGGTAGTTQSYLVWETWMPAMGVDLAITGHDHQQKIFVDWGKSGKTSPYVITGGGGGVTSQRAAELDGSDNGYGFMEFEMTLQDLTIKTWSHGGVHNKQILIDHAVVKPVPAKSFDEIRRLGLDPQNLLQRHDREFTV